MEEKIDEILFKTILTNTEIDQCTKELLDLFSVKSSVIIEKERQRIWTELSKEVEEFSVSSCDLISNSDDVYAVLFDGKELD